MANNDNQIVLGLDIPKTAAQINADIKKLQGQLATVKATGALDTNAAVKQINSQIAALQSQLKTIHIKTNIDTKDVNRAAKQTGADIAQNIAAEISQSGGKIDSAVQSIQAELQEANKSIASNGQNEIADTVNKAENSLSGLAKLGASFRSQMSQAAQSLTKAFSIDSAVKRLVSETQKAISELKEIDTLLTKISVTNENLSESDLSKLGNNSFTVASKYGKSPTDYLSVFQEASRVGYQNAGDIAELSVAAQSTGDMTAELANQYIFATDKAYKMGGSMEKLTEVLDGSNNITNHNAVQMADLAAGMAVVGSQASSLGVEVNETTATLSTMIAVTQQSGSDMAGAFQDILLYLQQITSEEKGITAEGLAKYEAACMTLNVSLKETKNGITSLRDPMEVIRDLAAEYSKLDSGDTRRSNLLSAVGGKVNANAFNALLENYDLYEKMLQEYASGSGSMNAEAEKMANSWGGALTRLSNTWADTVENISNSDALVTIINELNELLSVINNFDGLDLWGTVGALSGLIMNQNGIGERTMFQW